MKINLDLLFFCCYFSGTRSNRLIVFYCHRCKPLFSEFAELPDRVTRKRKNQRTTRGRVKKEASSDESASDEDEVRVMQYIFSYYFLGAIKRWRHRENTKYQTPSPVCHQANSDKLFPWSKTLKINFTCSYNWYVTGTN